MSRNVSLLGCFNDRDQKMRKMAKNTALRLAEKQKQSTNATVTASSSSTTGANARGKTTGAVGNTGGSQSIYAKTRVANSTGNTNSSNTANTSISQPSQMVKFPKVNNTSNKNIEAVKKPQNSAFRITNSRDRGRIQV